MSDGDVGVGVELGDDGDGFAVVRVRGELDLATVPVLATTLEQFPPGARVVVDMAAVEFIDSTTLKLVLAHEMRLADGGGSLRIRRPSAPVRKVFHMTALEHLVESDEG